MARRSSHRPTPPLPFLLGEASDEKEQEDTDPEGPPEEKAAPGSAMLAGHRLVTRLAVGGMSEVWLADALTGSHAGKTVALKRLLPQLRSDEATARRFRDEARLGSLLDHPNLARCYSLHESKTELVLVQELVGGETLGHLAIAARRRGERLSLPGTLHAAAGLLSALLHLHTGGNGRFPPSVHGDVNPDNLVATTAGGLKLIDLGLAEPLRADGTAAGDGALRGTPAYMAPEQVKGRPLTVKSDLFSAGIVLWELLANRPLFAAQTEFETLRRVREMPAPPLRSVWPEAPTVLERLCVRALAKEEDRRFSSARELLDAVEQAAQREGARAGAESLAAEVQRLAPKAVRADS